MGRTTVAKIFALAATIAALVVFGPTAAQADASTPAAAVDATSTSTTTGIDNNPWD